MEELGASNPGGAAYAVIATLWAFAALWLIVKAGLYVYALNRGEIDPADHQRLLDEIDEERRNGL